MQIIFPVNCEIAIYFLCEMLFFQNYNIAIVYCEMDFYILCELWNANYFLCEVWSDPLLPSL